MTQICFSKSRFSQLSWIAVLSALLCLTASTTQAQLAGTGAITGTVTDTSGAVIRNASVSATSVNTNVTTVRHSTTSGDYSITPLTPGAYIVTATAVGFQNYVQKNVNVNALSTVVVNVTLSIGTANETVTVTTAPPNLETTDATIGGVMEQTMYSSLPLSMSQGGLANPDQRRATDFEYLMPGVQGNLTSGTSGSSSGIVNGSGSTGGVSELYIDGVNVSAPMGVGDPRLTWTAFGVDSIDQFQVQTAGYSAQYAGQGVENFSVKQGTNGYHGSVYEFFRNTALDTWPFTAKVPTFNSVGVLYPNGIKPRENQNEYGVVVGGPIIKNKLFLFYNYGQYRFQHGPTAQAQTAPTATMLNGDFTGWAAVTGYHIYDPATQSCTSSACARAQFVGLKNGVSTPDVIPSARSSQASVYYDKFMLPSEAIINQNAYSNNLNIGYTSGLSNWYETGRLDYNMDAKNQLSIIVAFGRQAVTGEHGVGAANGLPTPYNTAQSYAPETTVDMIKDNYTITPHMVNQLAYAYGRYRSTSVTPNDATQYAASTAGLLNTPPGQATNGFPGITFGGVDAVTTEGGYAWNTKASDVFTLTDNLQWVRGKHNFTIGGQINWMEYNYLQVATPSGPMNYTFNTTETAGFTPGTQKTISTSGASFASYLIGAVDQASVKAEYPELGGRNRDPSLWGQDDYKVNPRLTLNLGLRWDIYPSFREVHNAFTFLNSTATNPITGNSGTLEYAGNGPAGVFLGARTPASTSYKNIGPRLGLAYSADNKTVIRASYGIVFAHGDYVGGNGSTGPSQLGITPSATAPAGTLNAPAFYWDSTACTTSYNNGVPCGFNGTVTVPTPSATYGTGNTVALGKSSSNIAYMDRHYASRAPEYINWTFGVERALTQNMSISISYVGSEGHFENPSGKARGVWNNDLSPAFSALNVVDATGTTNPLLTAPATPANIAQAQSLGFTVPNPYAANSSPFPTSLEVYQYFEQFPQYSGITDSAGFVGNSNFNALEITIKQRPAHGLDMMLNYTYSKTIDDGGTFREGYNTRLDRSLSTSDEPQNLSATAAYQLPFGQGHPWVASGWGRPLVSDWNLSGIVIYHSGFPIVATGTGCGTANIVTTCIPSIVPGIAARINGSYGKTAGYNTATTYTQKQYLNPAAFTVANVNTAQAYYQPGNAPRVAALNLWGPSLYNLDLGLKRNFPLFRESVKLQFEADLLNATNHAVFGSPNAVVGSSSFGELTSVANVNRDLQLSARISW